MEDVYYDHCNEFAICNELIEKYFKTKQYRKCFQGHLALAEKGYPLAECQVAIFIIMVWEWKKVYRKQLNGFLKLQDGDRDAQYNLAEFYENGIGIEQSKAKSLYWYRKSALQGQTSAIQKCREL